jgi:hypothetical protein
METKWKLLETNGDFRMLVGLLNCWKEVVSVVVLSELLFV